MSPTAFKKKIRQGYLEDQSLNTVNDVLLPTAWDEPHGTNSY